MVVYCTSSLHKINQLLTKRYDIGTIICILILFYFFNIQQKNYDNKMKKKQAVYSKQDRTQDVHVHKPKHDPLIHRVA